MFSAFIGDCFQSQQRRKVCTCERHDGTSSLEGNETKQSKAVSVERL